MSWLSILSGWRAPRSYWSQVPLAARSLWLASWLLSALRVASHFQSPGRAYSSCSWCLLSGRLVPKRAVDGTRVPPSFQLAPPSMADSGQQLTWPVLRSTLLRRKVVRSYSLVQTLRMRLSSSEFAAGQLVLPWPPRPEIAWALAAPKGPVRALSGWYLRLVS